MIKVKIFGSLLIIAAGFFIISITMSYKQNITTQEASMTLEKRATTKSGLSYEIIKPGNGLKPKKGQLVTVHYAGYLDENDKEGSQFDSSFKRNQPFTFVLGGGQVIAGWDEGVADMAMGEKRLLIIPSKLGYGPYGIPGVIPGGATLYFEVELLQAQ